VPPQVNGDELVRPSSVESSKVWSENEDEDENENDDEEAEKG
jgi:hypothetical protein